MSYNLSDLLEKKPFHLLTVEERTFVLTTISAEDYEQQRSVILMLQDALNDGEEELTPIFPIAAMAALKEQPTKESKRDIWFIFKHKTPTWAAVAAGFILYFIVNQISFTPTKTPPLKIAQEIDTVYIEKYVRSIKPSILPKDTLIAVNSEKPREIYYQKKQEPLVNPEKQDIIYTSEMLNAGMVNYTALLSNHSESRGFSLQNDSLSQRVNHSVY